MKLTHFCILCLDVVYGVIGTNKWFFFLLFFSYEIQGLSYISFMHALCVRIIVCGIHKMTNRRRNKLYIVGLVFALKSCLDSAVCVYITKKYKNKQSSQLRLWLTTFSSLFSNFFYYFCVNLLTYYGCIHHSEM